MNINEAFPSDFLKSADIKDRCPMEVVINGFELKELNDGTKPAIALRGFDGWLILNKTNSSMIAYLYGNETDDWMGKRLTMRVEPVPYAGKVVDAIRVYGPKEEINPTALTDANSADRRALAEEEINQRRGDDFDDELPL